jgi:hypothetical protein
MVTRFRWMGLLNFAPQADEEQFCLASASGG